MSLFSTLPILDIGETLARPEISKTNLTAKNRLRLQYIIDSYALSYASQKSEGITKLAIRVMGAFYTRTQTLIPPSVTISYWPGFDHHRVATQSKRLTTLIRELTPNIGQNNLLVAPYIESDRSEMEREVGTRMLIGRQYDLPILASSHKTLAAITWINSVMENEDDTQDDHQF